MLLFLLYSPLNQGLKHSDAQCCQEGREFLLYSPLNQGLKHRKREKEKEEKKEFLLYSPLNQGLKLDFYFCQR